MLDYLRSKGIAVQITSNGTVNAVPSGPAVPTEVTSNLAICGTTIISLCNVEDIQFNTTEENDETVIAAITALLAETLNNLSQCCTNTCAEQIRQRISASGTIGRITSTTHENLIDSSAKPIVTTGLGTVLLRGGNTGANARKYDLVSLCQVSALDYTPAT